MATITEPIRYTTKAVICDIELRQSHVDIKSRVRDEQTRALVGRLIAHLGDEPVVVSVHRHEATFAGDMTIETELCVEPYEPNATDK